MKRLFLLLIILILFMLIFRSFSRLWNPFNPSDWNSVKDFFQKDVYETGLKNAVYEKGLKGGLYEKVLKPAGEITAKAAVVTGDVINIATSGGHCPNAYIECLSGYDDKISSCGSFDAKKYFSITGGCNIHEPSVKESCSKLCQTEFGVDSSGFEIKNQPNIGQALKDLFTEVFSGKLCKRDEKVDCFAGYDQHKTFCGTAKIGRSYGGLGKGCIINSDEIKPACDLICTKSMGVDSNA